MFIENASILEIDLLCVLISFLLVVEIFTLFSGSCNKSVASAVKLISLNLRSAAHVDTGHVSRICPRQNRGCCTWCDQDFWGSRSLKKNPWGGGRVSKKQSRQLVVGGFKCIFLILLSS